MNDDLTPWEQKERLDELEKARASAYPCRPDAVWDDGGGKSQVVNPSSAPYPPPYDPGRTVEHNGGAD